MPLKTYSHLAAQRRMPTEYEVVSSRLLWYLDREPEVKTPVSEWVKQKQRESPVAHVDFEQFSDPRQTTYQGYVALQSAAQAYVDGLLAYDQGISLLDTNKAWRGIFESVLAPMRFPCHGLMMLAAYIGQVAPGGKLVICCALQAADETRHIDGIARYLAHFNGADDSFAQRARSHWQSAEHWQPLRKVIEQLLVPQGWFESLIALNFILKPLWEDVAIQALEAKAIEHGDHTLGRLLESFRADMIWHRDWAGEALATALLSSRGDAVALAVETVVEQLTAPVVQAIDAVCVELRSCHRAVDSMDSVRHMLHAAGMQARNSAASREV